MFSQQLFEPWFMYSRDDVGGGYLEVEDGGAEDSGDYPEPDALDPMDDDEDYSSDGPEAGEDEGLGAAGSDGDYDPYDDGDADVPMEMAGPLDRLGALKSAILQLESEGDFAGAEELREEYYTERAAEKIRADLTPLFGQARGFAEQQLVQGLRDDEVEVLQREVMPGVDPLQVAAYPKAAEALRYIAKGLAAERRERHGRVPGNERIASGGFGRIPGVDPREVSRFSQVFGDLGATPEDVAEFIRGDR